MPNKLKLIWQFIILSCYKQNNHLLVTTFTSVLFYFSRERSPLQNIVSCVSVSTQTASDDQAGKLWDELSLVGLPDAIDVQALFDPTGINEPGSHKHYLFTVDAVILVNFQLNSKFFSSRNNHDYFVKNVIV